MENDGDVELAQRRRPRRAILFVVNAVIVVVAVVAFLLTRDADETSDSVVPVERSTSTSEDSPPAVDSLVELEGAGDDTTDVFAADLNWELRWSVGGEDAHFEVELFSEDGESRGVVIQDREESEGSTFVSEAGSFYLEVRSDGDWTIDILGRPPE